MATDPRKLPPVRLRGFNKEDRYRLKEVLFYHIVSQVKENTRATSLPMQTTIPELLAYITNTHPGTIGHAFNTLDLNANKPSTMELMVASRWLGLPSSKVPRTRKVFYDMLAEYRRQGQPALVPVLSGLQNNEITKFLKAYAGTFFGKNDTNIIITKAAKENL